jgi:hypothetical protein
MLLPERKAAPLAGRRRLPNRLILLAFMVSDSDFLKSLSVCFP